MVKVSPKQEFEVVLAPVAGSGVRFIVPFSVQELFGKKSQIKVKGTIDGCAYRTSLFPIGDGNHYMVVTKPIRTTIGKSSGDSVKVVIEVDTEERTVLIPEDFKQALDDNPTVKAIFDNMAYTHRREYVEWIEGAKRPETRSKRIQKAIERIPSPNGSDFL